MDEVASFQIHLSRLLGREKVVLNGEDITHMVRSVNVGKPTPSEPPFVILEILADSVDLVGEGVAYLDRGQVDLEQFLEGLNSVEIDAEALERESFGGGSLTATVVQIIRERLRGPG